MNSLYPEDECKDKSAIDGLVGDDIQELVPHYPEGNVEGASESKPKDNQDKDLSIENEVPSSASWNDMTVDELKQRVGELEDLVLQLQAENEALARGRQESWRHGYQAGLNEAGHSDSNESNDTVCDTLNQKAPFEEDAVSLSGERVEGIIYDAHGVGFDCPDDVQDNWKFPDTQYYENLAGGEAFCQAAEPDQSHGNENSVSQEAFVGEEPQLRTAPINEEELRDLLKFRFAGIQEEVSNKESESRKIAGTKFVGGHRTQQAEPRTDFIVRNVPPDIRKACLVLGLRPEEITKEIVHKAWKREMTNPGTHPDIGGETEIAVYINTAKDTLYRWLDAQAPKLGKKFGSAANRENVKQADKQGPQHSCADNQPKEGESGSSS